MVRRSIAYAPQIGVTTLLGFIFGHNEPSLRLFEKLGFQRWGFLPRVVVLEGVEKDSRWRESNSQPTVYKTVALPLSYIGGIGCKRPMKCGFRSISSAMHLVSYPYGSVQPSA